MKLSTIPVLTLSVIAAADFSENLAVGYDGDVAAAGGPMFGIGTTDASTGESMAVDVLGTAEAIADGALSAGDELEVGTGGRLAALDAGVRVARVAPKSGSSAQGDHIEVLLTP